jgi:iron-sulfur cluster assembly accessory protein
MELSVTNEAKKRIEATRKEGEFVRISLISGGCHGFSYKFGFDKALEEDDYTIKSDDGSVIVAIKSKFAEKLQNSILDFKKTISASYFVLESSNFDTKCGCGTSFSLKS